MEILIFSFSAECEASILSNFFNKMLATSKFFSGTSFYRKSEISGNILCFDVLVYICNDKNIDPDILKSSFLSYSNGYLMGEFVYQLKQQNNSFKNFKEAL